VAIFLNFSGKKEEREYENGVLNGSGVTYGIDGDKFEFTYVDGRIEGEPRGHSYNTFYTLGQFYKLDLNKLLKYFVKRLEP
jgi:hypothetical protein